jgi:hypothetical protein
MVTALLPNLKLNGERTPLPGQLRVNGRQGYVRSPHDIKSLWLILRDDSKKTVLFVRDAGGKKDSSILRRKHVP